jgi:dihydroneopterin aldolase
MEDKTMSVQLAISYETLVELVEQLPEEQQQALIERLLS